MAQLWAEIIYAGEAQTSRLDEDALPGALFGRFHGDVFLSGGDQRQPLGALGVSLGRRVDRAICLDIGEAVVKQDEYVGGDLLAQAITRAEILINPDSHRNSNL